MVEIDFRIYLQIKKSMVNNAEKIRLKRRIKKERIHDTIQKESIKQ